MTAREAVLALWDNIRWGQDLLFLSPKVKPRSGRVSLDDFRSILMYATENPTRRRRQDVDVPDLVRRWMPIIRGLARAHNKRTVDQCEFEMDQHLQPLLTAPVAQIRAFYQLLCDELEHDDAIPFFVWAAFRTWGEVILKHAPDSAVLELKKKLANEIAELVERQVLPDLKDAIAGALQWRGEEALMKIKTAVESGGKARMVGRESCLFLEVGGDRVML